MSNRKNWTKEMIDFMDNGADIDIESIPFGEPQNIKQEVKRKFLGIWIPREIWLSEELTLQEKILIVEINSLDNDNGCFASNAYFSKFFGLSTSRISHIVQSLVEKGWITATFTYKDGGKEVDKRTIRIADIKKLILEKLD